jgi:endonuclease YncB( thermonuclease family)
MSSHSITSFMGAALASLGCRVGVLGLLLVALGSPGAALEYVAHAIDGDTIVMLDGEVVKLENVDAPELRCQCVSECRRARAAFSLTRDATASGVELNRRTTRDDRPPPDRNRRTIARVSLPDGRDLGELLISRGLGRPYAGERRQSWCP